MFSDNLSASVLQLCDRHDLSYEAAAERCLLSARYFGDIARGKAVPSILTLEKLCRGFQLTPNDLLLTQRFRRELSYRDPMPVTQVRRFSSPDGHSVFPICPRCDCSMERDYQPFCDRCGQMLLWTRFPRAVRLPAQKR